MSFKDLLGKELLFFDGAMGTMLQARGLKPGELPELWNFTHADVIKEVHTAYLKAGVNIIKTNTFGANRLKFAGTDIKTAEVVAAGVHWVGALHAAFAHEVDGAVGVWGKISSLTCHHICSGHSHVELFVKRAGD